MSDDQIRDLFATAREWSPEDEADDGNDDGGTDSTTDSGNSPPTSSLPSLQLGSDVEIARRVAQVLDQQHGEIIFAEGSFWYYSGSHWHSIANHELRCVVHRYDGAAVSGGRPVKLSKTRIDSIINEMSALLAQPNFFQNAPVGINCASGFISFSTDGVPSLGQHDPQHRCRHALEGAWYRPWDLDDVFKLLRICELLLLKLLEGVFFGDPDAEEKRTLLAEIAGAVALGYGTRLLQPKAVILEGKTAENGKSQILDLFRGLLPASAIASVPAAKMADQSFLVQLAGKHLNASDELSGAEAIASEMFKTVVTGEPVTGRDLYRSAITFSPIAQHIFGTNVLPSFKGGIDRGVQRRLLVITFNRTIPEPERIANIGRRITETEADQLLLWAVAGAARLLRQGGFSTPPSSKSALRDWLLGADPVLAWLHTCVEAVDPETPSPTEARIKSSEAYDHFKHWAVAEGFRENTLPAISGFVQRLRANCPSIGRPKHTNSGNFLTGLRIKSANDSDNTNLFANGFR